MLIFFANILVCLVLWLLELTLQYPQSFLHIFGLHSQTNTVSSSSTHSVWKLNNALMVMQLALRTIALLLVYPAVMILIRQYQRDRQQLSQMLQEFSILNTECTDPADKPKVLDMVRYVCVCL